MKSSSLAIGVHDLDRLDSGLLIRILGPRLNKVDIVDVEFGNQKVKCRIFADSCPIESAALAIDVLGSECRKSGILEPQVYIHSGRGWKRILRRSVLLVIVNGKRILNQEIFGVNSVNDLIPLPKRML